jgi:hypothetical protein
VRQADDLAELAGRINAEHEAGERATRKGLEHFRAAGEALLKAKKQCGQCQLSIEDILLHLYNAICGIAENPISGVKGIGDIVAGLLPADRARELYFALKSRLVEALRLVPGAGGFLLASDLPWTVREFRRAGGVSSAKVAVVPYNSVPRLAPDGTEYPLRTAIAEDDALLTGDGRFIVLCRAPQPEELRLGDAAPCAPPLFMKIADVVRETAAWRGEQRDAEMQQRLRAAAHLHEIELSKTPEQKRFEAMERRVAELEEKCRRALP